MSSQSVTASAAATAVRRGGGIHARVLQSVRGAAAAATGGTAASLHTEVGRDGGHQRHGAAQAREQSPLQPGILLDAMNRAMQLTHNVFP